MMFKETLEEGLEAKYQDHQMIKCKRGSVLRDRTALGRKLRREERR
jgi:hypothetical protein